MFVKMSNISKVLANVESDIPLITVNCKKPPAALLSTSHSVEEEKDRKCFVRYLGKQ